MKTKFAFAPIALSLVLVGCGRKDDHGHDHPVHEPAHHEHVALHGGKLVEVGEHQFNLELLHDPAAGKLSLWVLDAHAENFVRVSMPTIPVMVTVDGADRTLPLAAVANPATGETVGETSQFEGTADWLKDLTEVPVRIPLIEIRSAAFRNIETTLRPRAEAHHDDHVHKE